MTTTSFGNLMKFKATFHIKSTSSTHRRQYTVPFKRCLNQSFPSAAIQIHSKFYEQVQPNHLFPRAHLNVFLSERPPPEQSMNGKQTFRLKCTRAIPTAQEHRTCQTSINIHRCCGHCHFQKISLKSKCPKRHVNWANTVYCLLVWWTELRWTRTRSLGRRGSSSSSFEGPGSHIGSEEASGARLWL